MSTRRLFLMAGLTAAIIAEAAAHFPTESTHIDRATFNQIVAGMPRRQVEALLRAAPGDYASREMMALTFT